MFVEHDTIGTMEIHHAERVIVHSAVNQLRLPARQQRPLKNKNRSKLWCLLR